MFGGSSGLKLYKTCLLMKMCFPFVRDIRHSTLNRFIWSCTLVPFGTPHVEDGFALTAWSVQKWIPDVSSHLCCEAFQTVWLWSIRLLNESSLHCWLKKGIIVGDFSNKQRTSADFLAKLTVLMLFKILFWP